MKYCSFYCCMQNLKVPTLKWVLPVAWWDLVGLRHPAETSSVPACQGANFFLPKSTKWNRSITISNVHVKRKRYHICSLIFILKLLCSEGFLKTPWIWNSEIYRTLWKRGTGNRVKLHCTFTKIYLLTLQEITEFSKRQETLAARVQNPLLIRRSMQRSTRRRDRCITFPFVCRQNNSFL